MFERNTSKINLFEKDLTCISDYAQIVENAQIRYFATKQQSRKLLFLLKKII